MKPKKPKIIPGTGWGMVHDTSLVMTSFFCKIGDGIPFLKDYKKIKVAIVPSDDYNKLIADQKALTKLRAK